MSMWIAKIIRSIFFSIDSNLYNFIPTVYNFLITLSKSSILSQGQIKDFAGRIQLLIGVFMLFKVSFSMITYIINPDEFSDKSKGFGKLWVNIIISLILLVTTPYMFSMAYDLQAKILEKNVLANVVFGGNEEGTEFTSYGGQIIAFNTLMPFFQPNLYPGDASDHPSTNKDKENKADHETISKACNPMFFVNESGKTELSDDCYQALIKFTDDGNNDDFDLRIINNYKLGVNNSNLSLTFRADLVTLFDDKSFLMDYKLLLSTAAAVIVLLVLISFCMDVALRSVKLAFLQLISPIPIISYIDPKQGKDGFFKKWYSMCFSTYLSLFIRLLGLYFGIFLIQKVTTVGFIDITTGELYNDPLIILFMIIGILMFVKQLPKILEGFGLKLDGGGKFQLNPFKKFEEEAFGGKQILGTGAALGAAALAGGVNAASRLPAFGRNMAKAWSGFDPNAQVSKASLKDFGSRIVKSFGAMGAVAGSSIAGFTSAAFRGTGKMLKGEKAGKIFANSYGEAMFSRKLRDDTLRKAGLENAGVGQKIRFGLGALGADVARLTGNLNRGQEEFLYADSVNKKIKAKQDDISKIKNQQAQDRKERFSDLESLQSTGKTIDSLLEMDKDVKAAKVAWENAKSRGASDSEIKSLWDSYKDAKSVALKKGSDDSSSAIHRQVQLYNQTVSEARKSVVEYEVKSAIEDAKANGVTDSYSLSAIEKSARVQAQSDFDKKFNQFNFYNDASGNFVKTNSNEIYEIQTDASGERFYLSSDGARVNESDWASEKTAIVSLAAGEIKTIGDNSDNIETEKTVFESSDRYLRQSRDIKTAEAEIETMKVDPKFIQAQDEGSIYKLENSTRWNTQVEPAGHKPAAGPAQDTPHRGLFNPPSGNGGPPPDGHH